MRIYSQALLFLLTISASSLSTAAQEKTIRQQFDIANHSQLELQLSVADLDIEIVQGTIVEVEIVLEAQRRFFGLRSGNVGDVSLETRRTSNSLLLSIEEKKINQQWLLRVPAHLALQIHLGVGEVHIAKLENELVMDLGVGEVRVDVAKQQFREIRIQVGVGEASIRGMESRADSESSFVGTEAYFKGEGEHRVAIELGVGEVVVRGS